MELHHLEVELLALMEVESNLPEVGPEVGAAVIDPAAMQVKDTLEALLALDIIQDPLADINLILAGRTFPTTGLLTVAEAAVLTN